MSLLGSLLVKTLWGLERFQVNGSTIGAVASGRAPQRVQVAFDHATWKKFFNLVRIEIQLRMGRSRVSGYPFEWEIDTTNICQLRCPLCHTGLGTVHRNKGVMHFDVYKKTINEIKDCCIWLSLYSWGEPFLNKEIDRYVAYANEANISTIISSNLNKPLTAEMVDRLIRSGLDVLIVSLDGTTQDVYEVYRVGGRLSNVLKNVELLAQRKKELGSKKPYIEWQFIVMRQNEHQVPEARRMARELGVNDIVFKKVDFPHGEDDPELAAKWLPVATEGFHREQPFEKPYAEGGDRCWRLWRSAVVNWDGGYAPCCYLTDDADDFGNVSTHTIKEIWNNQRYLTARNLFKDGSAIGGYVGCLSCNVYLESKAAKKRGPAIPLHLNGHAPGRTLGTNGSKPEVPAGEHMPDLAAGVGSDRDTKASSKSRV